MHRLAFGLVVICLVTGPGNGSTFAEEHPVSVPLVVAPSETPQSVSVGVRVDWGTSQDYEVTLPATIQVSAADQGPGGLRILSDAWWTPEEPLNLGEPGRTLPPRTVFPATFVEGTVEPPRGSELPDLVHLNFYRPDFWDTKHWAITCPLGPGEGAIQEESSRRAFRCKVPAGAFDVRLRVEGFASVYRWDLALIAGKQAALGAIPLQPGSSLTGWLKTGDGTPFDQSTRVILENTVQADGRALDQRLKAQSSETTITEKGFFQITGLSPGSYRLRASQSGFADQELPGVTLIPGHESILLEPLVLERPLAFLLRLTPSADPKGKPWKVALSPVPSTRAIQGTTDSQGEWSVPALPSGEYRLSVSTHRGERWHSEVFELVPWNRTLEIGLSKVAIHGILTLDGSPVEAVLWFGGRSGEKSVDRYSDSEGHFRGFLPHAGDWRLEVELPGFGGQTLDAEDVAVEPDPETGVADLRIDLPALEIRGRVVSASGEAVEGARVRGQFAGIARFVSQRVDQDGRFHLVGLPERTVILTAELGDKSSDRHLVKLTKAAAPEEITLTLGGYRDVSVQVVSPFGPVPRARLFVYPLIGGKRWRSYPNSMKTTDLNGEVRFGVPEGTTSLMVTALAQGYAARIVRLPASPGEIIEVAVGQQGGTLRVDTTAEPSTPINNLRLVTSEGWVPLLVLHQFWATTNTENEFVIHNLEPNEFSLCPMNPTLTECDTGYLAPLGELELRVPVQGSGSVDDSVGHP
jgi:hypothetical protein